MIIWSFDPNWIITKGAGLLGVLPVCLGMMLREGISNPDPQTPGMGWS